MDCPAWARVGSRAVCIDASFRDDWLVGPAEGYRRSLDGLEIGGVYTISGVLWDSFHELWRVSLSEIARPTDHLGLTGFALARFRPVHTIEADVSMFLELTTPLKLAEHSADEEARKLKETIDGIDAMRLDEAERALNEIWAR